MDTINNLDTAPKKYAPPQANRNRSLNRRKSAEKAESDKSQGSFFRNSQPVNQTEAGPSNFHNQMSHIGLIPLSGCSSSASEASQLLNNRWAAIMNSYNDPSIDPSERPVIYTGASGSSWGHFKLPHQMNFQSQLQRAIESVPPNNPGTDAAERI